jgi:DegV family protein with EDD domain
VATAIYTDTLASLPEQLASQYGIRQVPIAVNFGAEVFKTGIDINDASLFERVDREGKLPTTSAPAPGDFSTAFKEAFRDGAESVLCFCVSSEVSATYRAAVAASQAMADRNIQVVDTRNLSMGQGFMVLAAAEAAQAGKPAPEILSLVDGIRKRSYMFAVLPTLKYLAMSGRVGSLAAGFANVISIKPILTVQDGKLDLLERVRTLSRAWTRAIELSARAVGSHQIERLAMVHVMRRRKPEIFTSSLIKQFLIPGKFSMQI